jgi:glycosyltransferase involved in cell wall biosynthesis
MSGRGHSVHVLAVVTPPEGPHAFLDTLRHSGVTLHEIRIPAKARLRERRVVRATLRSIGPDIVHTHGPRADVLDGTVARSMGIPTVTTIHGSSKLGGRMRLFEWLQFQLLRRFDAVIAVSARIQQDLSRRIAAPRLHLIPNGWFRTTEYLSREEARRQLGVSASEVLIGWVGRLVPVKGCDVFVRAFEKCRGMAVRAIVVGDGKERDRLEALTRELGLSQRLTFHGAHSMAAQLFPAFDLFVLSSRSEGTPITLFEAIAAGVPVVATAVGGVPDVLSSSEAVLVAPEDPEQLGSAMVAALSDFRQGGMRAQKAKERLEQAFGPAAWLERHETLYRSLLR